MQYDRPIQISAAGSRKSTHWPAQTIMWSELVTRLASPIRSTETFEQYMALRKPEQDELKDVGGFVGGTFTRERRKPEYLQGRDIITLDLDNIPARGTQSVLDKVDSLGIGYVVYSTRKHCEAAPRLRVLVCLGRTVTADEYEPIARKLAEMIGISMCDPTTFQSSRLMYWPSVSADGQYVYKYKDAPMLDADGMLKLYDDWHDMTSWPQVPGAAPNHAKTAAKQGDPLEKHGVVGAFNRVYDIEAAMDKFLPGVYEPCSETGRYTFTGGSTAGGAVLYDGGKFLYSHHATDPCGGKLVNAFDLVRLHLFGEQDDAAEHGTPVNRLPSYMAMAKFAVQDEAVSLLMREERYAEATQAFSVIQTDDDIEQSSDWLKNLQVNPLTNKPEKTAQNVLLMLQCDPLLRGRMRRDVFADRLIGFAPLPWAPRINETGFFVWTDNDDAGLRMYAERTLGYRVREIVDDALRQCMEANAMNPVTEFLKSVVWDGVPRLDTLFIDYLGAEDCGYTRTVTRKAFVAAVARAMQPGVKFDEMTVICGPQGIGKSTLIRLMGGQWFSDSVVSFDGKDGAELIQGIWIVEIGELHALNRSDLNIVKSFLARCVDQFRAAYGRRVESHPRQCVFFGTTNDHEYLHDPTGDRRFWPIDAMVQRPVKSVFTLDQETVALIWAEAVTRWQFGEPLQLSPAMTAEAERRRKEHISRDPMQGQIEEFLSKPTPKGWYDLTLDQHLAYWGGRLVGTGELVERDRVCAAEIIRECFCDTRASIDKRESARVNAIMERIDGWERTETTRFGGVYGRQRGYRRAGILSTRGC